MRVGGGQEEGKCQGQGRWIVRQWGVAWGLSQEAAGDETGGEEGGSEAGEGS